MKALDLAVHLFTQTDSMAGLRKLASLQKRFPRVKPPSTEEVDRWTEPQLEEYFRSQWYLESMLMSSSDEEEEEREREEEQNGGHDDDGRAMALAEKEAESAQCLRKGVEAPLDAVVQSKKTLESLSRALGNLGTFTTATTTAATAAADNGAGSLNVLVYVPSQLPTPPSRKPSLSLSLSLFYLGEVIER